MPINQINKEVYPYGNNAYDSVREAVGYWTDTHIDIHKYSGLCG